jgi:zinc protease
VIFATAEDLKTAEVSADELARAKGPLVEAAKRAQTDPSYWMAQLPGSDADQKKLDFVRTEIAELEGVTATDVMRTAQRWFDRSKSLRFYMTPTAATQ